MEKEKSQANSDSTGVCEKIYNTVAFRKSGRSRFPMAATSTTTNQLGVQTTESAAKASVPVPIETVAQHRAGFPREVHIPIEEKGRMVKPPAFAQNSSIMTISPAKIEPSGHSKTKEDTPKPVSQTTKPTTVIVHIEGRVHDVAPKLELVLPQPENLKPTVASGHGRLDKVASKKEAEPAASPLMEEKLKLEKSASPNVMVIKGHGQGNGPPRAEPEKPSHMSKQQEQLKPNVHAAAITKTMSTKNDQPSLHGHNKGDQEGKEPEHSTFNDKFSEYITRVRNKMRTLSNVSEETLNASPFSRLAARGDSFNDEVVTYINRARKNIRTPSNIGDA